MVRPMRLNALFLLAVMIATACSGKASARCEGMVMLGALHDAYLATLRGPAEDRLRAARTVLVIVGDQNSTVLERQVARSGTELDGARLSRTVRNAREIALQTLEGTRPDRDTFSHGLDVDWLGDIYAASGCQYSGATASLTPVAPERSSGMSMDTVTSISTSTVRNPLILLAAVLMACLALLGAHGFFRSTFLRSRRAERMPRYPISFPLSLTYTDPEGRIREADVEATDISRGGLKLNWPDPPPPGTLVTLPILGSHRLGNVVWANAYYAGIVLEAQLSRQELDALKELHKTN